ncbi:MAG: ADP-ribosylglycohydrolase family protein [Acidimicrobiia bacterium]
MKLTAAQQDRACGVLIASAVGDALGAGYEGNGPAPELMPTMKGGGFGNFAPGQWTDDTDQAAAIARVAATGVDLRTTEALDAIAAGFLEWFASGPSDVGTQTRAVLARALKAPTGIEMITAAREVHERVGRSAGNGSLMRTGPVALAYLGDPAALVEAAMAISSLTHYQDHAQEACALWCLMIRHAVLYGEFPAYPDVEQWMPNREKWRDILAEAETREPEEFNSNWWAVGALQAAWSAITHTPDTSDCTHLADSLVNAIRIGGDTDTVAAIAGALLGARWGMSAVPSAWRRQLHGWPGMTGNDLEQLAILTTRKGEGAKYGWPLVDRIDYAPLQYGAPALAQHPHDEGVWLASATALDAMPGGVDAVISLCLTGRAQVPTHVEHLQFRIVDEPDPAQNPNLDYVLIDAARVIAALREEGKTVLLHCVAAHSRTPAVGIAYSMLRGVPLADAMPAVCAVLPAASPNSGFRSALSRLEGRLLGLDR